MSKSHKQHDGGKGEAAALASLSPFELKDELIKAAGGGAVERPANASMLNAGRGNPNFLATIPRHGFWQLGLFAMRESERSFAYMPEGVGGFPKRDGLTERFELFLRENRGVAGIDFLASAVSYVRDQLGLPAGDFLYEMCEGILASNYPVPDRMLKLSEVIVGHYLRREMIGKHPFIGEFDIYAVEGGTAAMTYIFNTMKQNHLIKVSVSASRLERTYTRCEGVAIVTTEQCDGEHRGRDCIDGHAAASAGRGVLARDGHGMERKRTWRASLLP
ncbi:aspartate 4-decarboxylase [Paraburkholderia sp. WC7.3d]